MDRSWETRVSETTGRSVDDWVEEIGASGLSRPDEIVAYLTGVHDLPEDLALLLARRV
jgi:hypothetical protein